MNTKKNMIKWLAATMLLLPMAAGAQDLKVERKIAELGESDNQTWNYLSTLTGRFGGRLLGSGAYEDACRWMLAEFEKLGIEAHLEEAGEVPVGFNRGPWTGRAIGKENFELHFATPSYTSGTSGRVRGHVVIEPMTQREFDAIKGRVKGAWVLVGGTNGGWPIMLNEKEDAIRDSVKARNAEIERANQILRDSLERKGRWNVAGELQKPLTYPALYARELLAAGALGFIQSSQLPIRALYDSTVVSDRNMTFDDLPAHADIKLEAAQYEKIKKAVEQKQDIWLEFDIRNHFRLGPIKWHNVVATIPGTKNPEETVIISGHLDAYDTGTGAVDCGTGIGALMGAAHLIAKSGVKPRRTIKFVAFGGEEFGLLGASAYCEAHASELGKIVNLFNRDGGPTACTGINVPQAWMKDIEKIAEPMKDLWDFEFKVSEVEARERITRPGGTDATVFGMHGVPIIGLNNADYKGHGFDYFEIWHTENDILNKSFQDYMEQAATATAMMAVGIATLDKALPREAVYKSGEDR